MRQEFVFSQGVIFAKLLALAALEVLRNGTYAKSVRAEWRDMIDEASEGLNQA